jgi:hypothetical protein
VQTIVKYKLTQRRFEKTKISAPKNDESKVQSHGLSELDEVDSELEIPNNGCAVAVLTLSTRQKGNMSGNMK